MMQTSALSFTVCFDIFNERFEHLLSLLKRDFMVKYNENLTLITLRHYQYEQLKELTGGKKILLEQLSRNTAQVVIKS